MRQKKNHIVKWKNIHNLFFFFILLLLSFPFDPTEYREIGYRHIEYVTAQYSTLFFFPSFIYLELSMCQIIIFRLNRRIQTICDKCNLFSYLFDGCCCCFFFIQLKFNSFRKQCGTHESHFIHAITAHNSDISR